MIVEADGLPAGWDATKVRWLFQISSGDQIDSSEETEEGYPLVGGNGVRGKVPSFNTRPPVIAVGRVGALCGNVHEFNEKIWATEHALRLKPRSDFHLHFFRYALEAKDLRSLAVGTAQPVIAASRLAEERLPFPPRETQRTIADFLDREIAKIDSLIEKKQRLLELLQEKRTALITRAVTRGLDPDVPMKDSGVEWIGEIPEGWEVVRIGQIARRMVVGSTPSTSDSRYYESPDVPWYGPSSFGDHLELGEPSKKLDRRSVWEGAVPTLDGGSVLLVTIGATLGRVSIAPQETTFNQQITGIEPRDSVCDYRFLGYQLSAFRPVTRAWSPATTLPILNQGDLKRFPVALAPIKEQKAVAAELAAQETRVNQTRTRIVEAIALLEEYRTALISAGVTGSIQIDAD